MGPVVVTGGAGFLGEEIVAQLLASGCADIRIVDIAPSAAKLPAHVRSFRIDLRNDALAKAFDGAKTILHLAACQYHTPLAQSTYDLPFFDVNVAATRRVVAEAQRVKAERLVFVSTNMVYGVPRQLPIVEDHPRAPFGPYGQSKLEAEAVVEQSGLDVAVIRPGLIVGPGRTGVVARVFDWILSDRPVVLIGNGDNRYEMMACEDVASLVVAAAGARGFGIFNCSARAVPTMREWIGAVVAEANSKSSIIGLPGHLVKPALRALETVRLSPLRRDQYLIADRDYFMDSSHASAVLGWSPRWSGIDAALETFRWYIGSRAVRDLALFGALDRSNYGQVA